MRYGFTCSLLPSPPKFFGPMSDLKTQGPLYVWRVVAAPLTTLTSVAELHRNSRYSLGVLKEKVWQFGYLLYVSSHWPCHGGIDVSTYPRSSNMQVTCVTWLKNWNIFWIEIWNNSDLIGHLTVFEHGGRYSQENIVKLLKYTLWTVWLPVRNIDAVSQIISHYIVGLLPVTPVAIYAHLYFSVVSHVMSKYIINLWHPHNQGSVSTSCLCRLSHNVWPI